jgi:hypothetical protein
VRVLAFLSGAPDAGAGALDGARWVDAETMLFPLGASVSPNPALLQAAVAATDALALPQTDFYAEAGARAAVRAWSALAVLRAASRTVCASFY